MHTTLTTILQRARHGLAVLGAVLVLSTCSGSYAGDPDFFSRQPCPPGQHLTVIDTGMPVCAHN